MEHSLAEDPRLIAGSDGLYRRQHLRTHRYDIGTWLGLY